MSVYVDRHGRRCPHFCAQQGKHYYGHANTPIPQVFAPPVFISCDRDKATESSINSNHDDSLSQTRKT
jgi:hypothetical protein